MRLARIGDVGRERPVVLLDGEAVLVDDLVDDWDPETIASGGPQRVRDYELGSRPRIPLEGIRLGAPVARPTKVVCVGLNYAKHAAETGAQTPDEPIVFMKVPNSVVGPNDDIVLPPGSATTDYEVELAVVIGTRALYLPTPESASSRILGYTVSQDISERTWQMERGGQWVKGKSFPTFNPLGPAVVTPDEWAYPNARVSCSVNGAVRQDSTISDMIFSVNHIIWYISQFMELLPGDVVNTGTPSGVALGRSAEAYLRPGQRIRSSIEGLGVMTSSIVQHVG
jgi:2-keto-4-pentenoate hydratase/2-oxohepta-3-ene-1,7-dioic acid hydratase in catechol pathway